MWLPNRIGKNVPPKALAETFKQTFQIVGHIYYFWIALSSYIA